MANAKTIIKQPQGKIITYKTKEGQTIARLTWAPGFKEKYTQAFDRKQGFVDQECIRLMAPLTPRRTGVLIKTATLGTVIGSGEIHQIAPYARRQYYEHATKAQWFEEMKQLHKESILRGAQRIE